MNKKITCGYCKKEISEDSEKCRYCGKGFARSDIEKKIKNKSSNLPIWIGGVIGGVWGILNMFLGMLLIDDLNRGESIGLLRWIFSMPFFLTYKISKYLGLTIPTKEVFYIFGSIIIGLLMGLIIGFIISKIRKIK